MQDSPFHTLPFKDSKTNADGQANYACCTVFQLLMPRNLAKATYRGKDRFTANCIRVACSSTDIREKIGDFDLGGNGVKI